jgi:hypothetical protein
MGMCAQVPPRSALLAVYGLLLSPVVSPATAFFSCAFLPAFGTPCSMLLAICGTLVSFIVSALIAVLCLPFYPGTPRSTLLAVDSTLLSPLFQR